MLEPNVPIDEEHLLPFKGLPVCVVMNDGTRHFGLLTGCSKGKVVLNGDLEDDPFNAPPANSVRKPARRRARKGGAKRAPRKANVRSDSAGQAAENVGAPLNEWGSLGLAPVAGPSIVLPMEPIEAVLLL
ncbi:hypothetical protein [Cohnella thermotolerans]|uniref:hypothetical protein n=1 Tax=Cohnella thermotolerans TaxID=329858 RepID=UPI000400235B|nr:hypothetical protein [Cohnella thermotolerans]